MLKHLSHYEGESQETLKKDAWWFVRGSEKPALPLVSTPNMLIQGDNLLVLKELESHLAEKVKWIYLDPPYNTGHTFTQYEDKLTSAQWLEMMSVRLEILWRFLSPDGSLWISLDDTEVHYLKVLCDTLWGRESFIANIIWEKRGTRENRKVFSFNHDHILVYAKDAQRFKKCRNALPLTPEVFARYKNPDNDPRGPWQAISVTAQAGHATPSQFYTFIAPNGKTHTPKSRCWRYTEKRMQEELSKNNIWLGHSGNNTPHSKKFLSEVLSEGKGLTPETLWKAEEVGTNDSAKRHLLQLLGEGFSFDTPKPEGLLERILQISSNPGDIVLDAFLGSGTTIAVAHKMRRSWIGIEQGEQIVTACLPRMLKVLSGEDTGGVTTSCSWQGGGSFDTYEVLP